MGKFKFRLTTMVAALAVTVTTYVPVQAMPLPAAPAASAQGLVTDVQYRDRWDRRYDRRWDRREARRDYRRGYRAGYYNGYRGYRERRPGYRYYNGFWFPLAAFTAGAIISGGAQARPSGSHSVRHYQWCESRYRSYRASDNTFQPYNGPRRQCNSPYS
ncbi:BA14K family protein [Pseudorhizobium flavum]|uniref:Lectin-like protein BA14k n=1 Tax=Pseudorhizobium flavum TaxID=1335061 RepID=A0A7W9YZC6_9HYPH|nr:BA14K family protein [Pseudorhizobium flavum]MBB6181153.1 hypothetical protein [Pseudorhizobium flavum]CAD6600488.1 BA14K family protein [Pseudorhizobium flavum]